MAHIDGESVISRCKRDNMGFVNEDDVDAIAADPKTRLPCYLSAAAAAGSSLLRTKMSRSTISTFKIFEMFPHRWLRNFK